MGYVGIDVSKDRLGVHVLPEGTAFAVARDGEGLADLVEHLAPGHTLDLVAAEATGGFGNKRIAALAGLPLPQLPVRPGESKGMILVH